MQVSPCAALAASRTLIKGGYLPEGRIDDENTTLMVTENAYHQYRQFQQTQRQTLAEREAASGPAAEAAARAAHEQDISERLTPEQRAFVARGRDYVRQMDELNAAIDDAAVSERIAAIQEVVGRILARAEEEPAVIAGLDRLTAYYLPTTVKLLDAYDRLEEEPIQGENISSSRSEIEHTLDVLHSAFEKLFDDTYQDLSLDVSADNLGAARHAFPRGTYGRPLRCEAVNDCAAHGRLRHFGRACRECPKKALAALPRLRAFPLDLTD